MFLCVPVEVRARTDLGGLVPSVGIEGREEHWSRGLGASITVSQFENENAFQFKYHLSFFFF